MHLASESLEAVQRRAMERGWRAFGRVLVAFAVLGALGGAVYVAMLGHVLGQVATRLSHGSRCDGCTAAPSGSAVRHAGFPVGVIQQVAAPRGDRPLQMFLAAASSPASSPASSLALDSARAGHLRARLDQDPRSMVWTIELVPGDSVRGAPIAGLVVGTGQPPLLVWGDSASRP
jgi:hypothetical protein